jgi:hypothetical protein
MAKWHVNAVRLPLNEGCWLNLYRNSNDPYAGTRDPRLFEGARYREAIETYVRRLHQRGMAVIICLFALAEPGGIRVLPAPDRRFSPAFWHSVGSLFRSDSGVLFDLYNEPNAVSWSCLLHGCVVTTAGARYRSVGTQALVNTIRSAGARQPILVPGLGFSSDMSMWLKYEPKDPSSALAASFHTYWTHVCDSANCWNATIRPLAQKVPVIIDEFGEYDCASSYSLKVIHFANRIGASFLGWAWDAIEPGGWQCSSPSLITTYRGTPSPAGDALHTMLQWLFENKDLPSLR